MQHAQSRWSPALQPHGTCRMVTARLQTAACTCCRGNPPRATVKTTAIPLSHHVLDYLTCVGFVKTACRNLASIHPCPSCGVRCPADETRPRNCRETASFSGAVSEREGVLIHVSDDNKRVAAASLIHRHFVDGVRSSPDGRSMARGC